MHDTCSGFTLQKVVHKSDSVHQIFCTFSVVHSLWLRCIGGLHFKQDRALFITL